MRILIITALVCFGFSVSPEKLVKQKTIRFHFKQKGVRMVFRNGDYALYFNYTDFFAGSGTEKIRNAYDAYAETQRFYAPLNSCNEQLHGNDSLVFHIEATRRIFDLIQKRKVEIEYKGHPIKKIGLYIDKTCPPAAAIHWVYREKMSGKNVFDYYEVSIGCPAF